MGVYGNFLDAFPELFRTVAFWDRLPQIGAGFERAEEKEYRVIVLTDAQANFQDKKAGDYKALDFANHDVLYCGVDTPIKKGMFLRHPDDGDIFTIDVALDYTFTGGFRAWGIDRVQGANGMNQQDISIKEGVF
jgi:hypothetical protein